MSIFKKFSLQSLTPFPLIFACSIALAMSSNSYAATNCKGQSKSACSLSDSCSWIKSYKKKNGNTVEAYCRTKSKKKAKTVIQSAANKTSKKTTNTSTKTLKNSKDPKKIIKKSTSQPSN